MPRLLLAVLLAIALPLSATEPNPSLAQRDAINKLLVAMNMDAMLRTTLETLYEQMEKQMVSTAEANGNTAEDIEESKELFTAFRAHSAKVDLGGELREAYVRLYAKYFTVQELDAMTAFYLSPAGRKSLEVLPQMMQEAMQAGMDHLSPKLDQAFLAAKADVEKKRPWRPTMRDLRSVATAVEAYATDNNEYPSGDYAGLKEHLVPTYIESLPEKDIWGHAYAYVASPDRQHYRLVSAGSDTIFEWDSRRIAELKEGAEAETRYRERLEDDVIFADGTFVQLPLQAKPQE